ncbi:uncharacterized protein LOC118434324 [Folsomia candida]|nr:uncharacterized protein LOC118434324 [Folsomia candida]
MCQGYVWYYPVMDVTICGSTYPVEDAFIDFGITKYHNTTTSFGRDTIQIEEPTSLQGEFETVLNTRFNWSSEFRQLLETKRRYSLHQSICFTYTQRMTNSVVHNSKISYPNVAESRLYKSPRGPPCTGKKRESMPDVGVVVRGHTIFSIFGLLVAYFLVN